MANLSLNPSLLDTDPLTLTDVAPLNKRLIKYDLASVIS